AAADAASGSRLALDGDHAHRGLRLLLDLRLALGVAAPARDEEAAPAGHDLPELVPARHAGRIVGHELPRALQQVLLDRVQQLSYARGSAGERNERLLPRVAAHEHALVLLDVLGPQLE